MDREHHWSIVEQEIEQAMAAMFPHGAGTTNHVRVQHWLDTIAQRAFEQDRQWSLLGLMTAEDVAAHYGISTRRARALIANRHQRFGVGMKAGNTWLVHRDELPQLAPEEKYRAG